MSEKKYTVTAAQLNHIVAWSGFQTLNCFVGTNIPYVREEHEKSVELFIETVLPDLLKEGFVTEVENA